MYNKGEVICFKATLVTARDVMTRVDDTASAETCVQSNFSEGAGCAAADCQLERIKWLVSQ